MFCENCGKKLADRSAFCEFCGTKAEQNHFENNMENQHSTGGKRMNVDRAIKMASIFGIVIVAVSIAYYFVYRPIQKQNYIKQCNERNVWSKDFGRWEQAEWQGEYDKCLRESGL